MNIYIIRNSYHLES